MARYARCDRVEAMALIDHMRISATAGRGGDGVVRWLHMKGKEFGGPAGGDGGKGGNVVFEGIRDIAALARYRYTKEFRAEDGAPGEGNNKHGKNGADMIVYVPVGSVVTNTATGDVFEILEHGEQYVVHKGGAGGLGNQNFKSSVNQNPKEATKGKKGQTGDIDIELKLIADAGLIGFPNAGKSSLLNELTRAKSKIGAYAFTTLDPNLGSFYGYILADIPGLIEGASSGKGLGHKFLKHVERTKLLIHLVSADQDNVSEAYKTIRGELAAFDEGLASKQELVVLSRTDLVPDQKELAGKIKELALVSGVQVLPLSVLDSASVKAFSDHLSKVLGE